MDARLETPADCLWSVGMNHGVIILDGDQVERVKVRKRDGIKIGISALASQKVLQQIASGCATSIRHSIATEIGDHGKATLF